MKIGNDEIQIEFGELDKDGDVLITTELNYQQQREYIILSQIELEKLIAHLIAQLQKQQKK